MPSTVNRRCVVHILAKRARSQTVSIEPLWMSLNIGCSMLINSKMLGWYHDERSLYAHDVIGAFNRIPVFTGCSLLKEISSKSKIWYSMKLLDTLIPHTITCQKLEAKIMCYAFAKHEIAYWKHVSHWNESPNEKLLNYTTKKLYFTTENFTLLQKSLLHKKYALYKIWAYQFFLAFENWQSFFILIFIYVQQYK